MWGDVPIAMYVGHGQCTLLFITAGPTTNLYARRGWRTVMYVRAVAFAACAAAVVRELHRAVAQLPRAGFWSLRQCQVLLTSSGPSIIPHRLPAHPTHFLLQGKSDNKSAAGDVGASPDCQGQLRREDMHSMVPVLTPATNV
jgi:hypothetical protein